MHTFRLNALVVIVGCVFSFSLIAAEPDYLRDIKPILKTKCYACHSSLKQKGDLRLDAGKFIHESGIIKKELLARVTHNNSEERMPPKGGPLSKGQIDLLGGWIAAGAKYPADEVIASKPQDHWAFQPVQQPLVPKVNNADWPLNAIDHFILKRLETKGLVPNPSATPAQLLRRAHLDLIGLPPSLSEQTAFGKQPDLPKLIDNLLNRPTHGERYARHWLDVVRYADSNGYERDGAKPQVWRYRDYVIRALNDDKPFNQFIIEQMAGDETEGATTDTVLATGFNRLGPWDDEPADFTVDRYDQLDDLVNTTSQAFLGLTMGCARCHDHKFDPLLQTDYYSMVAIFNPLQRPQSGRTEKTRYAAPPSLVAKLEVRDKTILKEQSAIKKIRADYTIIFLQDNRSKLPTEVQLAFLTQPAKRNIAQKKLVVDNTTKIHTEVDAALPTELKSKIKEHETTITKLMSKLPSPPQGYFLFEASPKAPETHLLKRGNPKTPGVKVPAAVPVVLAEKQPSFLEPSSYTTRRRLSLAQWIINPKNPITARVIVNRVWLWHFGQALVGTPNDFGLIGERPTHPKLLDWLTYWFVHEARWSLKKLHKLIMSSRTWQMSREPNRKNLSNDPNNKLFWRIPQRRLEVEVLRDSMLFVSGKLNLKMYGPPIHPFVPHDALLNHADKESIWPKFNEATASRRTVYAFVKRSLMIPMMEVLDFCDTTQSSPKRSVTTVPTQALTLYNGNFSMRQAKHFADRLIHETGENVDQQIQLAWQLALSRKPTTREKAKAKIFLKEESLTHLCRVIFNLNEFAYPY